MKPEYTEKPEHYYRSYIGIERCLFTYGRIQTMLNKQALDIHEE